MVGTVSAVDAPAEIYIRSMAVLPRARGRGVGAELLKAVETYARRRDASRLILTTTPFLTSAIRLYQVAGFTVSPESSSDLHGTPLLTMIKLLRGDTAW